MVTLEGGGYVVASGDDEVTPILAYSKSGTKVYSTHEYDTTATVTTCNDGTITDSLSGTMTIDVSELDFTGRKADVPLFKVGNASILPAKGDVVVDGELPVPWRITTTHDGLGYRLNRTQGTMIVIY